MAASLFQTATQQGQFTAAPNPHTFTVSFNQPSGNGNCIVFILCSVGIPNTSGILSGAPTDSLGNTYVLSRQGGVNKSGNCYVYFASNIQAAGAPITITFKISAGAAPPGARYAVIIAEYQGVAASSLVIVSAVKVGNAANTLNSSPTLGTLLGISYSVADTDTHTISGPPTWTLRASIANVNLATVAVTLTDAPPLSSQGTITYRDTAVSNSVGGTLIFELRSAPIAFNSAPRANFPAQANSGDLWYASDTGELFMAVVNPNQYFPDTTDAQNVTRIWEMGLTVHTVPRSSVPVRDAPGIIYLTTDTFEAFAGSGNNAGNAVVPFRLNVIRALRGKTATSRAGAASTVAVPVYYVPLDS